VSDVAEKKRRLVAEVESIASSCKKITTRRREGVGIVVKKMKKVDECSTKNSFIFLTAIRHPEILCALYRTNTQFNKKTKLWKQNGRCLDDV